MTFTLAGHWEGLMHDIEGFSARVELELGDEGIGKFVFALVGDHCEAAERSGEVKSEVDPKGNVRIYVSGGDISPIEFNGRIYPVKVHAEAAITGTFTDPHADAPRGGVAIFWRYKTER